MANKIRIWLGLMALIFCVSLVSADTSEAYTLGDFANSTTQVTGGWTRDVITSGMDYVLLLIIAGLLWGIIKIVGGKRR